MDGLLAGIRVLDLTVWRPGPYATQLLADLGADVIKLEPPGGDPMRTYPELFASLSANKRSVMLDLKQNEDRARALELATGADVVIEGFRPGVAQRLGVGYDAVRGVNPTVVYVSMSGMGQTGPLAEVSGHDLNYQAWAGALAPEGGAPRVAAVPIADLAGGMTAVFAVCAAIVGRVRTGEGEYIDMAMGDVLATWTGAVQPRAEGAGESSSGVPGYGVFATADGRHLTLGVLTEDHFWRPLCEALGLDEVAALPFLERLARAAELQAAISAAVQTRDCAPLVTELLEVGVPVAPVLDRGEMVDHAHFRERDAVTADPWLDRNTGYPVRFASRPARRVAQPPTLDEHHEATWIE